MKMKRNDLGLKEELKNYAYKDEFLTVLQSSGKTRHASDIPTLQTYLSEVGEYPFLANYGDIAINYNTLLEKLDSLYKGKILFSKEVADEKTFELSLDELFYKVHPGYYLDIRAGYHDYNNFENVSRNNNDILVKIATVTLYKPNPDSSLYNPEISSKIEELLKDCSMAKNSSTPKIGMICKEDGFYVKDFYITKDYSVSHPDLHYGKGFSEFNKNLLERFKQDSKGLVLLHGDPGTGKTYYIRSLIKDLVALNKFVIYFPPSMVTHLVSPEIMTFLAALVLDKAEEGQSCVLLLEDAEPLLVSRGDDSRSTGITNLLNITDGLLNDMLNIQVIATFNTDLKNIDQALLRPERLLARKQFRKLNKEDGQLLCDTLGLKKEITADISLAEIYSINKQNEILIHDYNDNKTTIGFKPN